jgi:hypothetical protein
MITSAFSNANQGRSRAFIPIVPSDSSLVNGMTPLAMNVFATGMRRTSANVTSESAAPCRMTPLPARMIGALAAVISLAASPTLRAGASAV